MDKQELIEKIKGLRSIRGWVETSGVAEMISRDEVLELIEQLDK